LEDGHRWVAKLDVKKFFDRLPHGPVLAALATAVPDKGCCREIEPTARRQINRLSSP
jgi:hypothetical protein